MSVSTKYSHQWSLGCKEIIGVALIKCGFDDFGQIFDNFCSNLARKLQFCFLVGKPPKMKKIKNLFLIIDLSLNLHQMTSRLQRLQDSDFYLLPLANPLHYYEQLISTGSKFNVNFLSH